MAIASGRCEVAMIAYASRQRTKRLRVLAPSTGSGTAVYAADPVTLTSQFQTPYGMPFPIGSFAMQAARHMAQYGTTAEQLAEVAVTARRWASLNPKAWVREPLTVDEVLRSKMISDPLHRLDCCLVTDGGGVVILTHAARARDAAKRPIRILGAGESHSVFHADQMGDLTVTPATVSGRNAFAMAGVTPAEVDFFEPYDAFTINVIMQLEDLGFCPKGEGGRFVEDGRLGPGGELPTMTAGGGLSYCHPGALSLLLIIEAVRQLRGEAGERQVPDAKVGVVHGIGGIAVAATLVLGNEG
jgi:acetyl-CoA acetyltransferase